MRQSDIARAIRAAHAEGLIVDRIEIENGKVAIVLAGSQQAMRERRVIDDKASSQAAAASAAATARDLIDLGKKRRSEK